MDNDENIDIDVNDEFEDVDTSLDPSSMLALEMPETIHDDIDIVEENHHLMDTPDLADIEISSPRPVDDPDSVSIVTSILADIVDAAVAKKPNPKSSRVTLLPFMSGSDAATDPKEAYFDFTSMSCKSLQTKSKMVDVVFICDGGQFVWAHQFMFLQHSSLIRDLNSANKCCHCQGSTCHNNREDLHISLAGGVRISHLELFMELMYLGHARLPNETAVTGVKEIMKMLGVNIDFKLDLWHPKEKLLTPYPVIKETRSASKRSISSSSNNHKVPRYIEPMPAFVPQTPKPVTVVKVMPPAKPRLPPVVINTTASPQLLHAPNTTPPIFQRAPPAILTPKTSQIVKAAPVVTPNILSKSVTRKTDTEATVVKNAVAYTASPVVTSNGGAKQFTARKSTSNRPVTNTTNSSRAVATKSTSAFSMAPMSSLLEGTTPDKPECITLDDDDDSPDFVTIDTSSTPFLASVNDINLDDCSNCGKDLRGFSSPNRILHLSTHYKEELNAAYPMIGNSCSLCGFNVGAQKALFHVAYDHAKLMEFLSERESRQCREWMKTTAT